jgi:light-regulated signal transduction histidine kinase (bacteriophytochrome)
MSPRPETSRREAIAAQALLSGLTELSTRAGHDLLGPLNQAGSLLTLFVSRYRSQLDSEADKLLEFLQIASTRMESVVAGVRKYMEIAGGLPGLGPVDLNASLASSLALLKKPISDSGAVIVSDPLPVVSADPAMMVTLFEILIDNAVKFRNPDASPRIHVSSGPAGEIAVADNGIGIDPEYSELVFRPFKRLNGSAYAGAGLGLATAKLITGLHGGHIRIGHISERAEPRCGTGVRFALCAIESK